MSFDVSYSRRSLWLDVADRPFMPWGVSSGAEGGDGEGALAGFEGSGCSSCQRSVAVRVTATVVSNWQAHSMPSHSPVKVSGHEQALVGQRRREDWIIRSDLLTGDAVGTQARLRETSSNRRVCW